MCFPSKRQKNNFSEDGAVKQPKAASASVAPVTSSASTLEAKTQRPKTAIVYYSMYGHIGTGMLVLQVLSNAWSHRYIACQWPRPSKLALRKLEAKLIYTSEI